MARWRSSGRGSGGGSRWGGYGGWAPYVPVAERRAKAAKQAKALEKKGQKTEPVLVEGRKITSTFWGKAWCENLERYSDFSNRLPRGRTYVRNGSVFDLKVGAGKVNALVSGSSVYKIEVGVVPLLTERWKAIKAACSGKIASVVELLQGKISQGVMEIITAEGTGLFPSPREIKMTCSCPDSAYMCKHIAAALYGIGARLDARPELLFLLRDVDHMDLLSEVVAAPVLAGAAGAEVGIAGSDDISRVFGIELDAAAVSAPAVPVSTRPAGAGSEKAGRAKVGRTKPSRRRRSVAVGTAVGTAGSVVSPSPREKAKARRGRPRKRKE